MLTFHLIRSFNVPVLGYENFAVTQLTPSFETHKADEILRVTYYFSQSSIASIACIHERKSHSHSDIFTTSLTY